MREIGEEGRKEKDILDILSFLCTMRYLFDKLLTKTILALSELFIELKLSKCKTKLSCAK